MKLNAYCIFDNKALVYHAPFFLPAIGAAVRAFTDLANDLNTTIGRHPADYSLFGCGEYDDQKGALIPCSPLVHICDAVSLVSVQHTLPLKGEIRNG